MLYILYITAIFTITLIRIHTGSERKVSSRVEKLDIAHTSHFVRLLNAQLNEFLENESGAFVIQIRASDMSR